MNELHGERGRIVPVAMITIASRVLVEILLVGFVCREELSRWVDASAHGAAFIGCDLLRVKQGLYFLLYSTGDLSLASRYRVESASPLDRGGI
jgi:hypothetical protein